jgi:hypothetical protein
MYVYVDIYIYVYISICIICIQDNLSQEEMDQVESAENNLNCLMNETYKNDALTARKKKILAEYENDFYQEEVRKKNLKNEKNEFYANCGKTEDEDDHNAQVT